MKKSLLLIFVLYTTNSFAYVPTVESAFRHGANPEVTANGIVLNLLVKKLNLSTSSSSPEEVSLLKETKASIAQIAIQLTYDPSNFSKFFKKWTGLTPGNFRKGISG